MDKSCNNKSFTMKHQDIIRIDKGDYEVGKIGLCEFDESEPWMDSY
ncbi:MAG: hypothetical protein ACLRZ7_02405 [Lachnospiraceae bacterium]